MDKNTLIREVMTDMPHSIGLDQSVATAKEMLRKFNIRHLPVQKGGKLIGIVTDRDINFALGFDYKQEKELVISDVYTPEPYSVSADTRLSDVLTAMGREHYGCALVVEGDKLVGIFTTVDACRAFARSLG